MIIAVDSRFLLTDYDNDHGSFLYECFQRIIKNHPEHSFILVFDKPYDKKFSFPRNVIPAVTGPAARHPLLWKLWYDVKLPSVIKKFKADVLISCNGICSLNTQVPQCLFIYDLSFLNYPSSVPGSQVRFYKRYMPKFLNKASTVITTSELLKKNIISQYKTDSDKITAVSVAAREIFHPLNEEEKQSTKNKYTGGKEYFVYAGSVQSHKNFTSLLKAFSVFKKRQQSNWKLMLAGKIEKKNKNFTESLNTYKYREDVIVTGHLEEEELARVIGSAYCFVNPFSLERFGIKILEAMQSGVAIIISANPVGQEIAKEAALYADANDHNDIAEKMMLIYKDEKLRRELIEKGKKISSQYSIDKSADQLWQCIMKTLI